MIDWDESGDYLWDCNPGCYAMTAGFATAQAARDSYAAHQDECPAYEDECGAYADASGQGP